MKIRLLELFVGLWQIPDAMFAPLCTLVGVLIAAAGVVIGHLVARRNAADQASVQLVAERNDHEIEGKKLDFEILKTTVETLRTDLTSLRTKVEVLETRLDLITRKYWRLVHVVRSWVARYHIDPLEIPEDVRGDL